MDNIFAWFFRNIEDFWCWCKVFGFGLVLFMLVLGIMVVIIWKFLGEYNGKEDDVLK